MRKFKFEKIGSTSDYLKNKEDKENFDLVIAKVQTSGRGRRGNLWESPLGAGLFSFALKEDKNLNIEDYSKLPLVVGIALLNGLKKIENLEYKFKWTNDIYLEDKKLSGILVEKVGEFFIIGIGININNNKFLGEAKNGISLKTKTNKDYDIDKIIEESVKTFRIYWNRYIRGEWKEILAEINAENYLLNKEIIIEFADKTTSCIGGKILESGKLEAEITSDKDNKKTNKENQKIEIMVGEVHIKL